MLFDLYFSRMQELSKNKNINPRVMFKLWVRTTVYDVPDKS
jgi:hypothetical protein